MWFSLNASQESIIKLWWCSTTAQLPILFYQLSRKNLLSSHSTIFRKKECSLHNSLFAKKKKTLLHSVCHHSDGHACFQPVTYLKQLSGDITLTSSSILKGTSWSVSSTHCGCTYSIHCWHQTLWFSERATMNTETKTWYFLCQWEADNFFFSHCHRKHLNAVSEILYLGSSWYLFPLTTCQDVVPWD